MREKEGRLWLSPSELSTADRCLAWHDYKYTQKAPEDPRPHSLAFLAGCHLHAELESFLKGTPPEPVWDSMWPRVNTKLTVDEARQRIDRLFELIIEAIDDRYEKILAVEEKVIGDAGTGLNLWGYPDIVGVLPSGRVEVLDLKVSGTKHSHFTAKKHRRQLAVYVNAIEEATHAVILGAKISEAKNPRTNPVGVDFIPLAVRPGHLIAMKEDAHALVETIQMGLKRYTGAVNGSCSFCPYSSRCPAASDGMEVFNVDRIAA